MFPNKIHIPTEKELQEVIEKLEQFQKQRDFFKNVADKTDIDHSSREKREKIFKEKFFDSIMAKYLKLHFDI